jgi:thiamine-phosphate pyrophosphorylase
MFIPSHPKLYFVSPEIGEDIEKWITLIQQAVLGGVEIVQIRDKRGSAQKIIAAARRISPFLKKHGVPLLINDRVDIAHAVGADGVHLGQSDLKVSEARSIMGPDSIIGLSVETIDQAIAANKESVHYLAASPVFHTNTKSDCNNPWGLLGIKQLVAISNHPIIAIGGIDLNNAEDLLECGACGIAIVSAISKALCPKTAAQKFIEVMRRYGDTRVG